MTLRRNRLIFWLIGITFFAVFLYSVKSILLPFVVGILVAYFLDPAADRLEKAGLSRTISTLSITVIFFFALGISFVLLAPPIYEQLFELVSKTPQYIAHLQESIYPYIQKVLKDFDYIELENEAKKVAPEASSYALQLISKLISGIWQSGIALVNIISLIFITPIVSFYLLKDWDNITKKVDKMLPKKHAKTIRVQIRKIDQTISGFVRGQTNVCIIMAVFYSIGLIFVGLDFGLIIGIGAGLLTFIPYAGIAFSFIVALAVAIFQFDNLTEIGLVVMVFLIGQVIESNVITPKLVGDKVGLHPVWIIFGMLAGATLFGFVGVLIAVPVTAVIGVLLRFSLEKYLHSNFYKN